MKFISGSAASVSRLVQMLLHFLGVCAAGFVATGIMSPLVGLANGTETSAPTVFDIAPQSLELALDSFNSTSNVQVLYETALTSGRRSGGVHGSLTPEAALDVLLEGTGLTVWRTTNDSYSLVSRQDSASLSVGRPPPEITRYGHFLGSVQAGLLKSLCRNPRARPGQYRIALKFRIGPSGDIQQTSLLDSTGDPGRDAEIISVVQRLTVGEVPPAQLAQPITMVIAPRSPDATGDCAAVYGIGASR